MYLFDYRNEYGKIYAVVLWIENGTADCSSVLPFKRCLEKYNMTSAYKKAIIPTDIVIRE